MILLRTLLLATVCALAGPCLAQPERIYIMNAPGYNTADQALVNAIQSLGHHVDVSTTGATALPVGFTSAFTDPDNGYHWLCFFGNQDRSALIPQVQTF